MYQVKKDFQHPYMDVLTNQIRRPAISMPSTVAEGVARISTKVFLRFLSIAKGAAAEPEAKSIMVKHLGYTDGFNCEAVDQMPADLRRMLAILFRSIEKRSSEQSNH